MLFQDPGCWWKPARRAHLHEGVDFRGFYEGPGGKVREVSTDLVPSLFDGVVVRINEDFLGRTVWMKHPAVRREKLLLFSAFGHIVPEENITEGQSICQGEAVGRIAPGKKGASLGKHLHMSVFWAPTFLRPEGLNWQDLPASRMIRLFDPLSIVSRGV